MRLKRSRDGRSLGRFGVGLPPQRVQDAVFLQGLCKACLALRAVIGQDDLGGRGRIGPQAQGGAKRRPGARRRAKRLAAGTANAKVRWGWRGSRKRSPLRGKAPLRPSCVWPGAGVCVWRIFCPPFWDAGHDACAAARWGRGRGHKAMAWLSHQGVQEAPMGGAALDFSDAPCGSVLWGHTCAWRRRGGEGAGLGRPPQRRQARAQRGLPTRARAGPRSAQYRFEPSLRIFEGRVIAQRCPKAATRWKTPG